MKDIKCPLCGEKLKMIQPYEYESIMAPGCLECGYQVLNKTDMNNTLSIITEIDPYDNTFNDKSLEHFISKFPPIMRLRQGDNVLVWLSDDIHTVLGTDLASGKIHLQDVYGDADSYPPDGIKKWPWELEQKGGK